MSLSYDQLVDTLKQVQNDLVVSEKRVRSLLASIPMGLLIANQEGCIEFANDAVEMMLGYSHKELRGKHLTFVFPNATTQLADMLSAQEPSSKVPVELQAQTASGSRFFADVAAKPFGTESQNKLLVTVQDVTSRHELDQMRQDFVAMVTHDLRSPLTSIQLVHEMLTQGVLGPIPDQARQNIDMVQRAVDRLLNMVSDLLDMQKLEVGEMVMNFESVSLTSILEQSVASVKPFADKHGIELKHPKTQVTLVADAERLIRVLINLLSNAVKFSPQGTTVTVEVKVFNESIEVQVIDCGKGVSPEHHASIFEKYKQVGTRQMHKMKGTGLGLPICKAIIEHHNGTIGVLSEEGQGSTFWIRIPTRLPSSD